MERLHEKTMCTVNSFKLYRHVMKASPLTATAQAKRPKRVKTVSDDAVAAVQTAFRTSGTSLRRVTSSCQVQRPQRAMFSDPRVHPYLAHMYYDIGRQKSRASGVVT